MKRKLLWINMGILIILASCRHDHRVIAAYEPADSGFAYLKVINASPFFRQVNGAADSFNVYVNGTKFTTPYLTYAPSFPASYNMFPVSVNPGSSIITNSYAAVGPGITQFRLSFPGIVNIDSITIYTLNKYLLAGRFYTLLITDSLRSSRDSSQIFVQDNFSLPPAAGSCNIRFINACMNDTAGKAVDLFSYARNSTVITNVKPGGITSFQQLNFNQAVPDTFYVTRSGPPSSAPLSQRLVLAKLVFNTATAGNASFDQRSFTFYFKGDANATTGSKARTLSIFIDR